MVTSVLVNLTLFFSALLAHIHVGTKQVSDHIYCRLVNETAHVA